MPRAMIDDASVAARRDEARCQPGYGLEFGKFGCGRCKRLRQFE